MQTWRSGEVLPELFVASIRVLYDKLDFGFTMLEEILNHSVFTDEKRLGGEFRKPAPARR